MLKVFAIVFFGLQLATLGWSQNPRPPETPHLIIFDGPPNQDHARQVQKIFTEKAAHCTSTVTLHSLFDSAGNFDFAQLKQILTALESKKSLASKTENSPIAKVFPKMELQQQPQYLIHFSWNKIYESKYADLVKLLSSVTDQSNIILVAASGAPHPKDGSSLFLKPVSETVMGKISQAFLIGALDANGKLDYQSFYGREIFTALLPPESLRGSSFSAPLFTSALACHWRKLAISAAEMKSRLRAKRAKSGSLYPTLTELF